MALENVHCTNCTMFLQSLKLFTIFGEVYLTPNGFLFFFRFWYEREGVFTPDQKAELMQATLHAVICQNGDDIRYTAVI